MTGNKGLHTDRFRFLSTGIAGIVLTLVLASCGRGTATSQSKPEVEETPLTERVSSRRVPRAIEMPIPQAELLEYQWSQVLGRDDIQPIYDPKFAPADEAGYAGDDLVMGVAIDGEAQAYPVGLLNRREMVNDEIAGIPILVTW